MPRANRYIVAGKVYHLIHRCHNRQFLLKFATDRNGYRRRLLETIHQTGVSLLTYSLTSNHVHLVAYSEAPAQVSELMEHAAGKFAQDYNRRKRRKDAFWEGRYHVTMVDSERVRKGRSPSLFAALMQRRLPTRRHRRHTTLPKGHEKRYLPWKSLHQIWQNMPLPRWIENRFRFQ